MEKLEKKFKAEWHHQVGSVGLTMWWEFKEIGIVGSGRKGRKGRRWETISIDQKDSRLSCSWVVMERAGRQIPTLPISLPGFWSSYRGERINQLRGKKDPSCELSKNTRQIVMGWSVYPPTCVCGSQDFEWPKSSCSITYHEHILLGLVLSLPL